MNKAIQALRNRVKASEELTNGSSIHEDYKNLNSAKSTLNSLLRLGVVNPNKVSTTRWQNYTQNAVNTLKSGKPYRGTAPGDYDIDNLLNEVSVIRGYDSTLRTDLQDPVKLNAYAIYREHKPLLHTMRMSATSYRHPVNSVKRTTIQIPVQTWNHHSQDVTKLIMLLKRQMDDLSHVNYFDSRYSKMKPSYIKYITAGGQTFYFPEKMLDLNGDSDASPTLVPSLINNRNNYRAREKRQLRLVDNYWRQLHSLEINHHWFQYNDNDEYMNYANKSIGDYQYKTVHDEVWYQYYLERIRNEKNSIRDSHTLRNNNKIQKEINYLQKRINYYYYHTRSKYWVKLAAKRDKLRKRLRPFSKYDITQQQNIKHNQNKANWWLNLINHRNAKFKDQMRQDIEYGNYYGTIENIRKDPHYTHYGYIRPRNPDSEYSYIYFQVTDESPAYETQVNSTPSEWGVNATTGTTAQQTQVTISGYLFNWLFSDLNNADGRHGYFNNSSNASDDVTNTDAYHQINSNNNDNNSVEDISNSYRTVLNQAMTIASWSHQGAEMYYSGQNMYPHCVISAFTPDLNNSGDDGSETTISFSMTLTITSYFDSNIKQNNKSSHRHGPKGRNKGKKSSRNQHGHFSIPVKQGYTYSGIAARYHVSVSQLRNLNHWPDTRIPIYVHGRRNRIQIR